MTRFLVGQLHVLRPRADLGRFLFAFAPLLGAALIAISRCEDYRHDVYDVSFGSLLGISLAYFSYRRYFPQLKSFRCHLPYPSRAAADAAAAVAATSAQNKAPSPSASKESRRGGSSNERRSSDDDSFNGLPDAEMLPLQPLRHQPESSVDHHHHNGHDHHDGDDNDGDDYNLHDLERGNYYSAASLREYHRETDS